MDVELEALGELHVGDFDVQSCMECIEEIFDGLEELGGGVLSHLVLDLFDVKFYATGRVVKLEMKISQKYS